jgi:hypothetical protein
MAIEWTCIATLPPVRSSVSFDAEREVMSFDRGDPHARERAFDVARQDPPGGVSAKAGAVAIAEVLESIGETCPECSPENLV